MYIYIHIHMYIYIHIYTYIHIYIYSYIHLNISKIFQFNILPLFENFDIELIWLMNPVNDLSRIDVLLIGRPAFSELILNLYMYVHIFVCMGRYIYVCVDIYVHKYIHIHVYVVIYTNVYIYINTPLITTTNYFWINEWSYPQIYTYRNLPI
jgi:hypothetical protein